MDASTLYDIFADSVRRWPDRCAIDVPPSSRRSRRRTVTYAELDRLSRSVAQAIGPRVTRADCIVVVLLPRTTEHLYAAQLATLRVGAAFACLDPAFPDGQIQTVLDDADPVVVLTDTAGRERLLRLETSAPIVDVTQSSEEEVDGLGTMTAPAWLAPDSLAYLIYTSGTTGQPKGVMIEHRSIVNLVQGDLATLGITPDDRVAQSSSPAYDSSIEETWFALAAGATGVVMDDETVRLGPDLTAWLQRERITMFCPAPTLLRSMSCRDPVRELPHLRFLHPGGEALAQDVADKWAPGRSLMNDYGPTETTVTALRGIVRLGDRVSIGRPVPGMRAWVVDSELQEVPDGEPGELCLGGIGLARGYHNDAELTARRFPLHPRLGRIYRTGDQATKDSDGRFYCLGRLDAQVKIRGYRIELEAIEARLLECAGVREAACTIQGDGSRKELVAFVVSESDHAPPAADALATQLRHMLPAYMVPTRFGLLNELPRNMSGKLHRAALPVLVSAARGHDALDTEPPTVPELRIAAVMQHALGQASAVSVHDDFFNDLGGDSLAAAVLISLLREDPETALLTVRDVYEMRTAAGLAARLSPSSPDEWDAAPLPNAQRETGTRHPVVATLAQTMWLLLGVLLTAPIAYGASFWLLPALLERIGLVTLVVLAPVIVVGGLLAYTAGTASLAVVLKRVLIGTYRPLRAPVWSAFYVRNWIVQLSVRLVPWRLIEGTVFQNLVLRALGARIGRRVHLHRGATVLQGGWDLLDIGDDASVGQDANLELVALEDGQIVVGGVTIGDGATLEVRAGMGAGSRLGARAVLSAWSYLAPGAHVPDDALWDGIPAGPAGAAPMPPRCVHTHDLSAGMHGVAMLAGRIALGALAAVPAQLLALGGAFALGLDGAGAVEWLLYPTADRRIWTIEIALVVAALPLMLVFEAMAIRLLGNVRPEVVSRWSPAYLRVRLKTEVLESAGRWLCGTLLWPVWLRAAGMKIGLRSEVGTIIDTVPELVEIGADCFFADGIHLAGPRISRGTVTLAPVRLGDGVFLGNHSVVGCGQTIPDGVLIGVSTVCDDRVMTRGTSWFGHPPFELANREPVACDRRLTHEPSRLRYLTRLFWEMLRFSIPLVPVAVALAWFAAIGRAADVVSAPLLLFGVVPALELCVLVLPPLFVVGLKWVLLGRVRPGTHPLWCCWIGRWDFLYVTWDVCASALLRAIEGSLLLNVYLRAMGVRLGRRVVLGPGFVQVADPDLLEFEDGATVTGLNQAHTFEDRVLKMDVVTVRAGATVGRAALMLYGADIGTRTHVMPQSVVMKRERLLPDRSYAGCPTRPVSTSDRLPIAPLDEAACAMAATHATMGQLPE
jgi:non-ribosomal peptide synthetase-like protein